MDMLESSQTALRGSYPVEDSGRTLIRPQSERRFAVRFADTSGHRNAASMLIKKMYLWRGYDAGSTEEPSVSPRGIMLVASDQEGTLGTLTLTLDSSEGLAAALTFPDEMRQLSEPANASLCELGKLAIDKERGSKWVLASLFHIAYIYGRVLNRVSDVVIEVNPRHVQFYRRMLGFEVVGEERLCPRVQAPAVLLRLRLQHVDEQIERWGGKSELAASTRSLYPYFFSRREEEGLRARITELGS